jgi:UDP-N-acetylmuramyl pentapeptide synthase
VTISVIIPVLNGAPFLGRCLESLTDSELQPLEYIVVDDRSTDGSDEIAAARGARTVRTERQAGPAAARNFGAARASGDVLVFVDSDVCVHRDTLARIQERFEAEPDLAALIGSYDDDPASPGLVSQYKNLLNHYVHQHGHPEAVAFWSACGAIRREVFMAEGGFPESYERPSVEDIDFGYRLRQAGHRIALDGTIQVKHLKRWTLGALVRSDIFDRALPWTRLILESGQLPNDLNVAVSQRISALLAWLCAVCAAAGLWWPVLLAPAFLAAAGIVVLNRGFFRLLVVRRGWAFAAGALPLHFAYYLYGSVAFAAGTVLYPLAWRARRRAQSSRLAGRDNRITATTMRDFLRHHRRTQRCFHLALGALAIVWRRLMFRTTFIAVTGSVGKSTAVDCLQQILSSCFTVNGSQQGRNSGRALVDTILRTRWRHRFTVIEVGTRKPGDLKRTSWMIAPGTAVVLAVAAVHTDAFAGLEEIAVEKSHLVARLGRRGVAVLNGDDARVAAMAADCRGKVVTFGRSPERDVWASEVSSAWPERLSFRVHHGAESRLVHTRLVGDHWLNSVLAALTAALSHGVELEAAAAAAERVEPSRCRMEPVLLPSGAYVLRDEHNRSFASLTAALRVLEQVQGRRILVFHDAYDSGMAFRERLRTVGQLAARSADLVLVHGHTSQRSRNAMIDGGVPPENVKNFFDIWGVADFLRSSLSSGDVVLLRGAYSDAAARIFFSQLGSVGCKVPACAKQFPCDYCANLRPGLEKVIGLPAPVRPFWLG